MTALSFNQRFVLMTIAEKSRRLWSGRDKVTIRSLRRRGLVTAFEPRGCPGMLKAELTDAGRKVLETT
jgi:hypothetical protein